MRSLTYRLSSFVVGALLLEQNDEWPLRRRYMLLETLAEFSENSDIGVPVVGV